MGMLITKAIRALFKVDYLTKDYTEQFLESPHRIVSPYHGTPATYRLSDADKKKITQEVIAVLGKYNLSYINQNAVLYEADRVLFQNTIKYRRIKP